MGKKFIYSSFACRKEKGVHGALNYFRDKVRSISRGGRSKVWVLKLDIAKFFVTIHRATLCTLMEKYAPFSEIKSLISKIYLYDGRINAKVLNTTKHSKIISDKSWFSQPPEFGLPIGNLTSQFGANVYLNGLDHFIQRELKPKAYLRYMDDLLLIDRDPEKMKQWAKPINNWLMKNRHQNLNPAKSSLIPLEKGILYLGYRASQCDNFKEPLQFFPSGKKKWKFIHALQKLNRNSTKAYSHKPHLLSPWLLLPERKQELASINSHFGSLIHSKSYHFRKKALDRMKAEKNSYEVKEGYQSICFHK